LRDKRGKTRSVPPKSRIFAHPKGGGSLDAFSGAPYLMGAMAIREILTAPDPVLKQVSKPVEGGVTGAHRALMDDMLETMYAAPGIGLAAVQIGVPLRIIVMDLSRDDEPKAPRYFINPEILWSSEDQKPWEEGCLSVPDIYEEVERPARIKLRYLDYNGKLIEEDAEDLFAVCIQHEMDHLEGVLFIDHLSRLKRESALRKLKKAQRETV
jgi:peptide deformylase